MGKTVLRDDNGEITHQLLTHNTFIPKRDYEKVMGTHITTDMIRETFESCDKNYTIARLLNEEDDVKMMRYKVLIIAGVIEGDNSIKK